MPWIDKENYLSNYNNLKRKYNKSWANLIGRERRKSFSEERNHLKSGVSNSPLPCFIKITFPLLQLSRDNRITPAEKFPYYSSKKPRECERVCAHNWRNYGCCSLNNKRAKDERKKERKTNLYHSLSLSFPPLSRPRLSKRRDKWGSGGSRQMQSSILDSLFALYFQPFFSRSSSASFRWLPALASRIISPSLERCVEEKEREKRETREGRSWFS